MKHICLVLCALFLFASCSKNDNNQKSTSVTSNPPIVNTGQALPQANQASSNRQPVYTSYTPAQAQSLIDQRKDLLIIDVRTPQELREGKLNNSVLVPFWSVMKGQHQIPKNRPLLVVCAVGGRSYGAMQILARQGYAEIYNLKGGISAWKKANLPLVY